MALQYSLVSSSQLICHRHGCHTVLTTLPSQGPPVAIKSPVPPEAYVLVSTACRTHARVILTAATRCTQAASSMFLLSQRFLASDGGDFVLAAVFFEDLLSLHLMKVVFAEIRVRGHTDCVNGCTRFSFSKQEHLIFFFLLDSLSPSRSSNETGMTNRTVVERTTGRRHTRLDEGYKLAWRIWDHAVGCVSYR